MVSYTDLDPNAPFATVFTVKGMGWAAKIVSIGALFGEFYDSLSSSVYTLNGYSWWKEVHIWVMSIITGCTNSNYGGILGQSRIFVTMARAGLLPKALVRHFDNRCLNPTPITWCWAASLLIAGQDEWETGALLVCHLVRGPGRDPGAASQSRLSLGFRLDCKSCCTTP